MVNKDEYNNESLRNYHLHVRPVALLYVKLRSKRLARYPNYVNDIELAQSYRKWRHLIGHNHFRLVV